MRGTFLAVAFSGLLVACAPKRVDIPRQGEGEYFAYRWTENSTYTVFVLRLGDWQHVNWDGVQAAMEAIGCPCTILAGPQEVRGDVYSVKALGPFHAMTGKKGPE